MTNKFLLLRKCSLYELSITELIEYIQTLQDYIKNIDPEFQWKPTECKYCDKWGDFGESNTCNNCMTEIIVKARRWR